LSTRLYLISPPRIAPTDFSGVLKDALGGGDVASFQLRLKHVSDDEIRRAADMLRPIVQAARRCRTALSASPAMTAVIWR
jgi:thiamine-phosphate pyrophosphorylase